MLNATLGNNVHVVCVCVLPGLTSL